MKIYGMLLSKFNHITGLVQSRIGRPTREFWLWSFFVFTNAGESKFIQVLLAAAVMTGQLVSLCKMTNFLLKKTEPLSLRNLYDQQLTNY